MVARDAFMLDSMCRLPGFYEMTWPVCCALSAAGLQSQTHRQKPAGCRRQEPGFWNSAKDKGKLRFRATPVSAPQTRTSRCRRSPDCGEDMPLMEKSEPAVWRKLIPIKNDAVDQAALPYFNWSACALCSRRPPQKRPAHESS
jgi:hypothetical protein